MYISEDIKKELDYYRRLHEHFLVKIGDNEISTKDADDRILYITMSASYVMDIFEEGFFENFKIKDTSLTGKPEILIDAYAFIETESTNEKHLHIFQYKLHEGDRHSASPKEVLQFTTLMNNMFVHPELEDWNRTASIYKEIHELTQDFLGGRRGRKIKVKCHYITNAGGINSSNEKDFEILNRFESDKQSRGFDIQVYGENDILDLIREGKIKVGKEVIEIIHDGTYPYRYEDNKKSMGLGLPEQVIIGICNVNELIRLQNKYHYNQLYSENIRLYLGDRAAVNKDIIQTITSTESIWFPYMNNGISVICDELKLGSLNTKKKVISVELANLQIINGCQTVNALYSAKYNDDTKSKFNSSIILIKIYQIDPNNKRFKQNVIRATNNQNAVKTYSLLSNDPIQIEIQKALDRIGFLYDRKGESKQKPEAKVVSMVQSALAYRAIFEFAGQKLRAKIGQTRVFQKEEYERVYKDDYLEDSEELNKLSSKLLMSSLLLDEIRDLIKEKEKIYIPTLPILKKSTYYLSGLYYAKYKARCGKFINECTKLLNETSISKTKHDNIFEDFVKSIRKNFDKTIKTYREFYDNIELDKTDIDNLLKSNDFGEKYINYCNTLLSSSAGKEENLENEA